MKSEESTVYLIKDITKKDGHSRTDGRYPFRIESRVCLYTPIIPGACMVLEYIRDAAGNQNGGQLRTSLVKEVSHSNDCLIVETGNSIYTLQEFKKSL